MRCFCYSSYRGIIKSVVALLSPQALCVLLVSLLDCIQTLFVAINGEERNSPDYTAFNTLSGFGLGLPDETRGGTHLTHCETPRIPGVRIYPQIFFWALCCCNILEAVPDLCRNVKGNLAPSGSDRCTRRICSSQKNESMHFGRRKVGREDAFGLLHSRHHGLP